MSAKRTSPEKNTSPKKKKKVSSGQLSLDQFFSSGPSPLVLSPGCASTSSDGKSIAEKGTTSSNDTSFPKNLRQRKLDSDLTVEDALGTSDVQIIDETAANSHLTSRQREEPENYPSTPQSTLAKSKPDDNLVTHPCSSLNSLPKSISIDITSESLPVNYPDLVIDPFHFAVDPSPQWSPASYSFLVHALSTLSNTRSRIAIINTLTNYLRCIILRHPLSLVPSLYLVTNSLAPSYLAVELGLGPSIITKALQQVSGLSAAALSKLYKSLGDPGDVAFAAKSSVRTLIPHAPLTTINVYETMLKIARTQGQGSVQSKQKLVEKLLLSAKGEEPRYLVRTLCQNLRVGAVRNSIITALARAMVFIKPSPEAPVSSNLDTPHEVYKVISPDKKRSATTRSDKDKNEIAQLCLRAEGILKHAFVIHPNLDDIGQALLDGGLSAVSERITLSVGVPLHPTLGSPARSLDEIYERLQNQAFTAELKYDGQRAQIHALRKENGEVFVRIFSRHLEDMTDKYPDVVALVDRLISRSFTSQAKISSFIIDSEIVAVDPDTGDLKSFQDLSQRARKDVRVEDIKVSVGVFAYDIMFLNDETQIEAPFRHRRNLLYSFLPALIPENKSVARFCHAEKCDSEEGQEVIEEFWATAVKGLTEGLMIKLLDHGDGEVNLDDRSSKNNNKSRRKPLLASYEPDKRTMAWIKLKKDYVEGIGDSLDMVPIGAWHGNGRKAAWWSPVLLAVWDPTKEMFVAVCKCMSGFTDAFYKEMKKKYAEDGEYCSPTSKWNCSSGGFSPSVYFQPSEVWEIRGADVTLSPVSIASREIISTDKGLSLRFPRFMKVRTDKNPDQASTTEFLADLWRNQESRGSKSHNIDEGELVELDWNSDADVDELSPSPEF